MVRFALPVLLGACVVPSHMDSGLDHVKAKRSLAAVMQEEAWKNFKLSIFLLDYSLLKLSYYVIRKSRLSCLREWPRGRDPGA